MSPRAYLIVDDNRAFAENLAEIIADLGDEAVVADGGERALELVRGRRFDALVCDMRMPVMDGAEVVHRVRAIDPGLPAVVVTAYTADEDLATARQEGLLGILHKPVPVPRLIALLQSARRQGLVALVEDDRALADNVTEVLQEHGFAVVTASSVMETERLGEVHPFVALVDLRLPGGADGEAMRRLAVRFPQLPIVVMTGHDTPPPLGHIGLFRKPFDTGALLATLERLHQAQDG
jgi:two-component system, response regulator PdtaR